MGSSSSTKRSRSPETAGGSTTHPPRMTISRASASISGGGPGVWATAVQAPVKKRPKAAAGAGQNARAAQGGNGGEDDESGGEYPALTAK